MAKQVLYVNMLEHHTPRSMQLWFSDQEIKKYDSLEPMYASQEPHGNLIKMTDVYGNDWMIGRGPCGLNCYCGAAGRLADPSPKSDVFRSFTLNRLRSGMLQWYQSYGKVYGNLRRSFRQMWDQRSRASH